MNIYSALFYYSVVLGESRENITDTTGLQISKIGDEQRGVRPDDPNNWIISGVFLVLTVFLLCVTVYLVKHKVNHVEEHYEEQKGLNGAEVEA